MLTGNERRTGSVDSWSWWLLKCGNKKKAVKLKRYEDAFKVVKQYGRIIATQKQNIV